MRWLGIVNFRPGWLLTLFVGVFLPLFLVLGVWQLNRAEQKTQLLEQIEAGQQTVRTVPPNAEPQAYQRYRVPGRLDSEHIWLVDNRTHHGRVGYEVWAPLLTDDGWYLASLGWIAGGVSRQQLPAVSVPDGERAWLGQWRPLSDAIVLAETPLTDRWPQVIQKIKPDAMAARMEREPPQGLLQLEAGQPGVGPVIWTPTVMSPQKHRGYALQWFAMATALALMYLYAGRRLARDRPD